MEGRQTLDRILEEQIADFETRALPRVTPRRVELPGLPGKIDVVVGMRRSGKTFLVYQQIEDLLRRGVSRERLLYLNFEDERLLPMAAEDLHLVTDAFYRRYPAPRPRCARGRPSRANATPSIRPWPRRAVTLSEERTVEVGGGREVPACRWLLE